MVEKKVQKTKPQSDYLSDSKSSEDEVNPMVERRPPKQPKIKKLSKELAADKHTQTKDKEKPL